LKKFVAKVTLVTVTRLLSRAADASDQPCASWHVPCNQESLLHANAAVPIERFLRELEVSLATFKRDIEFHWPGLWCIFWLQAALKK